MKRIFLLALALVFVAAACEQGRQEWKQRDRSAWKQDSSDWGRRGIARQRGQTGEQEQIWGRQDRRQEQEQRWQSDRDWPSQDDQGARRLQDDRGAQRRREWNEGQQDQQ